MNKKNGNTHIKVILADDQVLFVESLKKVLESLDEDMEIIAIAKTGEEAVEKVRQLHPHIILMDVRMPGIDGVEATKVIHTEYPDIHIIMLTTFDDDEYVNKALQYGAVGYLLKDIPPIQLIESIRAVNSGTILLSPGVISKLLDKANRKKNNTEEQVPEWFHLLSRREREVLHHIAEGLDNREIAEKMYIAEQTVRNHVSVIYSKIGEHDRIKLIKKVKDFI